MSQTASARSGRFAWHRNARTSEHVLTLAIAINTLHACENAQTQAATRDNLLALCTFRYGDSLGDYLTLQYGETNAHRLRTLTTPSWGYEVAPFSRRFAP
jgi:hypothetical protein